MNSSDHNLWSDQPNAGEPDFAHFLNYGDIPLNFESHSHQQQGGLQNPNQQNDPNAMDTEYTGAPNMSVTNKISSGMNDQLDAVLSSVQIMNENIMNMGFHNAALHQVNSAQVHAQLQQQQRQLQQFHMSKMIPPTPSSLELQSGDMTPQMYSNFYGMKDDQMIFTPLISPAVTPLDTSFTHLADYSMSGGGYFSPLTSPMLEAQRHGPYNYIPTSTSNTNTPKATSPIETSESPLINKKLTTASGRRKSLVTNRSPARVVRESPCMKPQRKKTPSSLSQTSDLAQTLVQQAQMNISPQQESSDSTSQESKMTSLGRDSSSESISPEPMPEALMAPPPPPPTAKNSSKQQQPKPAEPMGPPPPVAPSVVPVTPMMLMKLPKSSIPADTQQMPSAEASLMMLDNAHPIGQDIDSRASSRRGSLATLDEEAQTTPTLRPSNRTPARTPRGTPHLKPTSKSGTTSLRASRNTSPVNTQPLPAAKLAPASITPRLTPKLQPQPASSSSRKRSIPASPALAPKISPSIKPLLSNASLLLDPTSSLHTAASLLLASKSNYQNIVEGNSSSLGLSYPEELSTGLTSKRTSHKIAEQGRRNRINTALQEMASLLPSTNGAMSEDRLDDADEEASADKKGKHGGNQNTSKAVTVERAIEYIRTLKRELEETKSKLEEAEGKLKETESGALHDEMMAESSQPLTANDDPKVMSPAPITAEPEEGKEVVMLE